MADYILRVEAAGKPTFFQELSMKLIHNPLKTAGMALTSLAAFTLIAAPSSADEQLFKALDSNGDGIITEADSALVENVVTVLDRDYSGGVTLEEFKVRVVFGELNAIDPNFGEPDPEGWTEFSEEQRQAYLASRPKMEFSEVMLVTMDLSEPGQVSFTRKPMPETEDGKPPFDLVIGKLSPPPRTNTP